MNDELRLMCVLAHPDDESMGMGGVLAKYASEGIATYLVTATRGERGWMGDPDAYPGLTALGRIREAELRAAADVLGVREVVLLDYLDGELDLTDPLEVTAQIAREIRRVRPDVVVTFGHDGLYGHPDHIAICQFATAAVMAAANECYAPTGDAGPHQVSKLYYRAARPEAIDAYEFALGELVMDVDGQARRGPGWPGWVITTTIDTSEHWERVWEAVSRHRSQLPGYDVLSRLPAEQHKLVWCTQEYYRVFSLVNGGRGAEHDLFEGLRDRAPRVGRNGADRRAAALADARGRLRLAS
jgi:LmbE family N-acetylglucosaminyl deacetylase